MSIIHPLSPTVIAAIAAGEVAERPATIVKELIENALDADATTIAIDLAGGGLEYIIVRDNGIGMSPEDLRLSVQRHTTSKIAEVDDLQKLHSFGFRGEALASIGSAAKLTLRSRLPHAKVGAELQMAFGSIVREAPVATLPGTTVIVEELFAHLPARRKFLKSPTTELRLIIETVTTAALAHPPVEFSLTNGSKVLLQTPAQPALPDRLATIFGAGFASGLLPIHLDHQTLKLHGFLGAPQLARQTHAQQFLFVNGRPVTHAGLQQTIRESYGSLLAPRQQPVFIVFVELSPASVDCNVHPHKETIKFAEDAQVRQLVAEAVKKALAEFDLTYQAVDFAQQPWLLSDSRKASLVSHTLLRQTAEPWKFTTSVEQTPIFQLHHTYLFMQTPEGALLIDQHAAHERILYEQYRAQLQTAQKSNTPIALRKPVLLRLTAADFQTLQPHLKILTKLGFTWEEFGPTSLRITHVPAALRDRNLTKLFAEFVDDILQEKPVQLADTLTHRTLAYLACRNAVQAGDALTLEQRQELLAKLNETPNRYTCPHGRPTCITWTIKDLEKWFKRR